MLKVDSITVKRGKTIALDSISFTLSAGHTLAVVGESGAGKSTLISAILGLIPLSQGRISWCKTAVHRCRPSLVMQEPKAAFNPFLSIRQSVLEPIVALGRKTPQEKLDELCRQLEIPSTMLDRRPDEISIGQAQRAGIMRALIASPPLVLFDEPLSALDAATQKHTAQLIARLQVRYGFAAMIVTHDLGYAAAYSNQIAVLQSGKMKEITSTTAFLKQPRSEYGCLLRDAAITLGALEPGALEPDALEQGG